MTRLDAVGVGRGAESKSNTYLVAVIHGFVDGRLQDFLLVREALGHDMDEVRRERKRLLVGVPLAPDERLETFDQLFRPARGILYVRHAEDIAPPDGGSLEIGPDEVLHQVPPQPFSLLE